MACELLGNATFGGQPCISCVIRCNAASLSGAGIGPPWRHQGVSLRTLVCFLRRWQIWRCGDRRQRASSVAAQASSRGRCHFEAIAFGIFDGVAPPRLVPAQRTVHSLSRAEEKYANCIGLEHPPPKFRLGTVLYRRHGRAQRRIGQAGKQAGTV